ncbi:fibronectin type III domain-containing protein [Patescibacteria group bacterium]|nr:fibronectin type III domain-containing protein [Patescibacteria group bacterium]
MSRSSKYSLIFGGAITLLAAVFFTGFNVKTASATTPPSNVIASTTSACAVNVSWSESDTVDHFNWSAQSLPSGAKSNFIPVQNPVVSSGVFSAIWDTLVPNSEYKFWVEACTLVGACTSATPSNIATTGSLPPTPLPPVSVTSTEWTVSASGAALNMSWDASGIGSYGGFRIMRADGGSSTFNIINTFSGDVFKQNGSQWSDAVSTSTSHTYRIYTYQTDNGCFDTNAIDPSRRTISNSTVQSAWINFSSSYKTVQIPASPANLNVVLQNNGASGNFSWNSVSGATWYDFQVSPAQDFSSGTYSASTTNPSIGPINFGGNQNYYWRVRTCEISSSNTGCSAWSNASFYGGYLPPQNLHSYAYININGTGAAKLYWTDQATYDHTVDIFRKVSTDSSFNLTSPVATLQPTCQGGICNIYPTEYNDSTSSLPLGSQYDYEVMFVHSACQSNILNCPSATTTADLNISPLAGYAWSNANGDGGSPHGVGWISFSGVSSDGSPYGVYKENSTGVLSGYAWSNYGWLSFNGSDLSGCPSGSCVAQVGGGGQVTGWAKFLAADPSNGNWTGWLGLNGSNYGLTYAGGKFSGYAWGDTVAGWTSFCGTALDGSNYCVTSQSAPQITNLQASTSSIAVGWSNPQDFPGGNQIFYNTSTNPSSWKSLDVPSSISSGNYSYVIPNLVPNVKYYVKVRGLMH